MRNLRLKGFMVLTLLCFSSSIHAQVKKPTIADTKKWIRDKLSLYAKGFTTTNEVKEPAVILGNRISSYEINTISYTQSNLIFEFRVSTYLKNCCQEHTTNRTLMVAVPWTIFRSETNVDFTLKDSLTTGELFEPSANYALFFIADGNQISFSEGVTQVVHKTLNIQNGTIESTEESTQPERSYNMSALGIGISINGEQNLRQRLLKAFGDVIQYNKSKGEAY